MLVNVRVNDVKLEDVWKVDFSAELCSFVLYHKCGSITLIPMKENEKSTSGKK